MGLEPKDPECMLVPPHTMLGECFFPNQSHLQNRSKSETTGLWANEIMSNRSLYNSEVTCNIKYSIVIILFMVKVTILWITNLIAKLKTIKLLRENIGEKSLKLWFRQRFLRYNPESMISNRNINKWNCFKIKAYFSFKDIVKRTEKEAADLDKIFAKHKSLSRA